MHPDPQQPWWAALIPLAVVAIVILRRWRRLSQHQPLRVDRLWIAPALILFAAVMATVGQPPQSSLGWLWIAAGLALGVPIGWRRGRTMRIAVDPETHAITQQGSVEALVFIAALFAVKALLRLLVDAERASWHLDAPALADGLIFMAVGVIGTQRLEMALRARRLLSQARALGSAGTSAQGAAGPL